MAVLAALLAVGALAGCGDRGDQGSRGCGAMDGPEPLLVEERTERPQSPPYARRVTADGVFHELSATRVVIEGGETRFETQPLEWRVRWTVPAGDLRALTDAVRDFGAAGAPDVVNPRGTSIGGSDVTWTVCLDGVVHATRLAGAPDARHDATDRLKAAFDRALQAGADAARGAAGG